MKNKKNTQSPPAKKTSVELYNEYLRAREEEKAEANKQKLGLKPTAAQKKIISQLRKEYKQFLSLSIDIPYKFEVVLKLDNFVDYVSAEMINNDESPSWIDDELWDVLDQDLSKNSKKIKKVLESKLKPHRTKFNTLITKCKKMTKELEMNWSSFIDKYLNNNP